jgi:hypothetical protein
MQYYAKFQSELGYWENLPDASFDQAFIYLQHQINTHQGYQQAVIKDQNGKEILALRTIK